MVARCQPVGVDPAEDLPGVQRFLTHWLGRLAGVACCCPTGGRPRRKWCCASWAGRRQPRPGQRGVRVAPGGAGGATWVTEVIRHDEIRNGCTLFKRHPGKPVHGGELLLAGGQGRGLVGHRPQIRSMA